VENAESLDESAVGKRDIELLLLTTVQSLKDTLCGDTPIELVAMARERAHSTDAILTEPYGDTPPPRHHHATQQPKRGLLTTVASPVFLSP
jgi:hypothetical protein